MRGLLLLGSLLAFGVARTASADTIVFVDGTRMEIQSYEVKEGVVLFTTMEGKLRSVPRSYVNLVATEQANRKGAASPAPPARTAPGTRPSPPAPATPPPAPAPKRPVEMPTEMVEPEPPVVAPKPPPPVVSRPNVTSPPPVWSNEELQVSLVVPSSSWKIEDMPPSFDVAVALQNESTEARATLALIRQKLRGRGDFRSVVRDVESSISQAPGYRPLRAGELTLDPYNAHEFRFVKNMGFVVVYNRLVIVYSRDLAYVLSLTCPESRMKENEADFEALVRGLVVKKSRKDLSF
jgi:hypothetical protein